jgi:hypothetical protein
MEHGPARCDLMPSEHVHENSFEASIDDDFSTTGYQ